MASTISTYIKLLTTLRRAPNKGGAPHKPILLLSLLDAYRDGVLMNVVVRISPELIGYFKTNWNAYVETDHVCTFSLPFWHLRGESFWKLIANKGYEQSLASIESVSNINTLVRLVSYAVLDQELSQLMQDSQTAAILRQAITEKYFPRYAGGQTTDYLTSVLSDMQTEDAGTYRQKMELLLTQDEAAAEEEKYVRGQLFRREIPRLYNYSCCISGLRVDSPQDVSMIDACHIVPFAVSYNDTLCNGLALCPTLHRAFDRGLIAIDSDYRVLVRADIAEPNDSAYSIRQFVGKEIQLPQNKQLHPHPDHLRWHREQVFGGW